MLSFNLSTNMSENVYRIKLNQLFNMNAINVNSFVLTFLTLTSKYNEETIGGLSRVKIPHYQRKKITVIFFSLQTNGATVLLNPAIFFLHLSYKSLLHYNSNKLNIIETISSIIS